MDLALTLGKILDKFVEQMLCVLLEKKEVNIRKLPYVY